MKVWRTIPLFISSTFKDMDAERDYIKYHVIGRLNRKFNPFYISFQVVDLRLGINNYDITKEEEREDRVLDICFNSITHSRPFFIALIGNRYGWIPSQMRWQHVIERMTDEQKQLIVDGKGCSVTELEIMYGAIGDNLQYLDRSLFFIRSQHSYKGMSDVQLVDYTEIVNHNNATNIQRERAEKLDNLKNKILNIAESKEQKICFEYDLTWESKNNRFSGIEDFGELIFKSICNEVEQEIKTTPEEQETWYAQENINTEYLFSKNIINKIERNDIYIKLKNLYNAEKSVILYGKSGCGKSVILAQLYNEITKLDDVICLGAFIGATDNSNNMLNILIRWITTLESVIGVTNSDYNKLLNESKPIDIYNKFKALIMQTKGRHIVIFLDGFEKMEDISINDSYLPWVTEDVQIFLTATESSLPKIREYNPHFQVIEVEGLTTQQSQEMVALLQRLYMMEIPREIQSSICSRLYLPLYFKLLFNIFSNFSADDFRKIRSGSSINDVEAIHNFQIELFNSMPDNIVEMILFFIEKLKTGLGFNSEYLLSSLQYIASAKGGIREDMLERLAGKEWDTLSFHTLMYAIGDYVWENRTDHSWKFSNDLFTKAFLPNSTKERDYLYTNLIKAISHAPDNDSLRNNFLTYYLFSIKDSLGILKHLTFKEDNWQPYKELLSSRYTLSLPYILNEHDIEDIVKEIVSNYDSSQKVAFANSLLMYGTRSMRLNNAKSWIRLGRIIMDSVDIDTLSVRDSYNIAVIYSDMFLVSKHWSSSEESPEKRTLQNLEFNSLATDGFIRCCEQNSAYRDCKNMAIAMLSEQLESYTNLGQFDKIEKIFNLITKIQTL